MAWGETASSGVDGHLLVKLYGSLQLEALSDFTDAMYREARTLTLVSTLEAVLLVGIVGGADAQAPNDDAVRLGKWLEVQARQQRLERRFTGGALTAVGTGALTYGIVRYATNPNNQLSKGGGIALLATGAFGTGLGIFRLAVRSEAERTAERWERATAAGVDDQTVARFEGELYAAARHGRRVQLLARWLGVATATASLAVLIATPFANLGNGGRVAGYTAGGLLLLGGGINVASSLVTPPPMKAWRAYERGELPPPGSGRLWGLVPVVSRGYAAIRFSIQTGL